MINDIIEYQKALILTFITFLLLQHNICEFTHMLTNHMAILY